MEISQHCTTAKKKMTRVYLLGTRTNSFVSAVLYWKMINLNMLFSVLLTTFTFFFFLYDLWSCLKQSIPSCIFLFSNKIYNLPIFETCLVFTVENETFKFGCNCCFCTDRTLNL